VILGARRCAAKPPQTGEAAGNFSFKFQRSDAPVKAGKAL